MWTIPVRLNITIAHNKELKLTKELKKKKSDVRHAFVSQNVTICNKLKRSRFFKKVLGKGVDVFKPQSNTEVKGVIYNVSVELFEPELLTCLRGGNVTAVKVRMAEEPPLSFLPSKVMSHRGK